MSIKLAEALLRRKELAAKVEQLKALNVKDFYELKAKRVKVTDSIDDLVLQVTHEHDWYARQLRVIDAAIQQANWATEVNVDGTVMGDYRPRLIDSPTNQL
jgi:hypothetical protein